ncbi:MAG: hypothetical protein WA652_13305 [Xanthobacteraceae bacterium]
MPRYYFHFFDESTKNFVRDSQGASLSNASEAKKEAIGLAQDIVRHGFHGSTWQIVVTDANLAVLLRASLSEIRPRLMQAWLDRARRFAVYEPRIQLHIFTWLLTAVVLTIIVQAAALNNLSKSKTAVAAIPFASFKGNSWDSKARHICYRHTFAVPSLAAPPTLYFDSE